MRTDGFMNVIDFGTRKITYNLHREDRKRLRIVVAPELTVDVFAPEAVDEGADSGRSDEKSGLDRRQARCT